MDASVRQHLHAVTLRTLHANQFTRSSSTAAHTLTDILQRYLSLLALTSKQYAEQSGRDGVGVNVHDVVAALGELGVGIDELAEFAQGEGKELERYSLTAGAEEVIVAVPNEDGTMLASTSTAARRVDSLADIKSSLSEGLADNTSDGIILQYRPVSSPSPSISPTSSRSPTPTLLDSFSSPTDPPTYKGKGKAVVSTFDELSEEDGGHLSINNNATSIVPPLIAYPLSPVSNPAYSPPAKRARHDSYSPPEHIPEFLPPFPGRTPQDAVLSLTSANQTSTGDTNKRRALLPLRPTTTSRSGYTKAIGYSQSSLSRQWDVPGGSSDTHPPPPTSKSKGQPSSLQPLISAYHTIPTDSQPATNQSRLRVAHHLAEDGPTRYTSPDTLYTSTAPTPPRFPAPLPTHAVPLDATITLSTPLPKPSNRIVSDRFTAIDLSAPHIQPRLIKLAKGILPPHLYSRVTETIPPPALRPPAVPTPPQASAGSSTHTEPPRPLLYHDPIPAPWNTSEASSAEDLRRKDLGNGKKGALPGGLLPASMGGAGGGGKKLADANLFSTWDWTAKDPQEPLVARRGKLSAYATSSSLGSAAMALVSPSVVQSPMPFPMPNGGSGSPVMPLMMKGNGVGVGPPPQPTPFSKKGKPNGKGAAAMMMVNGVGGGNHGHPPPPPLTGSRSPSVNVNGFVVPTLKLNVDPPPPPVGVYAMNDVNQTLAPGR